MKKLFLSKVFGLIVLCFSLSSVATTLITKERICPLGGERFTVQVLGSYSTFGKRLDFKTLGTYGTDPFRLEVCPNGFVDYKENYSKAELNKLEDLITSDNYQTLRHDNTDYFLYRFNMSKKAQKRRGAPANRTASFFRLRHSLLIGQIT